MKLTKKHWIIVGVVALIVIWYFFIRKKPTTESESGFKTVTTPPARPLNCNCLKRLPDGSTAYGRMSKGYCSFATDCMPSKALKDKAEKTNKIN